MTDDGRRQQQRTLRGLVERLSIPSDEIDRAEADGTLGLLALSKLVLPEGTAYTIYDLEELTGIPEGLIRQLWRALGFSDVEPDEAVYHDLDVEALRHVRRLLDLGLTTDKIAMQITRVMGSSLARVAQAQVDALEATLDAPDGPEGAEPAVTRTGLLLAGFPRVLEYAWRRHLQVAARRRLVREAGTAGERGLWVGFADLVGFTALSQRASQEELASVVDRFESTAYDLVAQLGGRVVKMIGDEVMFAADHAELAVDIGLSLAEAYRDDPSLSDVRVAVAGGPVLEREGDLYGPTVNLASRMVAFASVASVVVSDEVHRVLDDCADVSWTSLGDHHLEDIGMVPLWSVSRATAHG